ncbi:MAG: SRPBCC domain-containing protein [Saprospiraceae bacterium]|nr:SRPBCC domain-containing protein [Saprospiraceae bacterium]
MTKSIKQRIVYDFPVQDVWEDLTDAQAMSEWLMECDIKPVFGHRFAFKTKSYPGFDGTVYCEVLEVIPPTNSFSWSGGSLQNSKVTFTLKSIDERNTELLFEHSGFDGLLNAIIVRKILANGWRCRILTVALPKYLAK